MNNRDSIASTPCTAATPRLPIKTSHFETMDPDASIQRAAVVGAGLIGSSWAALFLSRGLDVSVTDPAPGAEDRLRNYIDMAWPALTELGIAPTACRSRLQFFSELKPAVEGVDFIQESGPEREQFKVPLFARLDSLLPAHVVIASSSSGLTMSTIQRDCRHPERCVIGHPFNPPHLMPLVEIVGGRATSAETIARTERFYRRLGKHTIRLHKEVPGHVANRLQAALWREAVHLVMEGVVNVKDVDEAVSQGPGLRWALMGPNLIFHLGGGQGGMEHFLQHLSGPFARWWEDLGQPILTPAIKAQLIRGVTEEVDGKTIEELTLQRDQFLVRLLALRQELPRMA